MLQTGEVINGIYEVISVIDKGGMSVVYLAMNRRANKQWAIKEVRKTGDKKLDVVRQNLIVEIDMLKKLNHPNLPSIIDVIDRDDTFLIVMDYIQGISLQKKLKNEGAQSQENVVRWGIQICDVLQYLHSQNPPIIYRDMKPANVMLKPDGNITVIDFGTAREFKTESTEDTTCLGTKGYAAPEQYRGSKHHQTDERTDIYNFGVTLYHLLTNKHPNEPPYVLKPITEWNSNLSTGLEKIIIKCTKEDPAERYQSCAELMYDLQHYKDNDIKNLKKSRLKLGAFVVAIILSISSGITSAVFHGKYNDSIIADYDKQIENVESTASYDEKLLYCLSAISIDPSKENAYSALIDIFKIKESDDNIVFDKNESDIIKKLRMGGIDDEITSLENEAGIEYNGLDFSQLTPFDTFRQQNPEQYAEFCLKLGKLYWFYYEDENSRKSESVKWFAQVRESAAEESSISEEASCYESIGKFYSNISDLNYTGEDKGEYKKYWDTLTSLIKQTPDEDYMKEKLYEEIITNISVYASNLKSDGVAYNDIADMIETVENKFAGSDEENAVDDAVRKINVVYKNKNSDVIEKDAETSSDAQQDSTAETDGGDSND